MIFNQRPPLCSGGERSLGRDLLHGHASSFHVEERHEHENINTCTATKHRSSTLLLKPELTLHNLHSTVSNFVLTWEIVVAEHA